MREKILSICLALAICLSLLPTAALAEDLPTEPAIGSASLGANTYYSIDENGTLTAASAESWQVYYSTDGTDKTVTFNSAALKDTIYVPGGTTLIFTGENTSGTESTPVLYGVVGTTSGDITITGTGSYTVHSSYEGITTSQQNSNIVLQGVTLDLSDTNTDSSRSNYTLYYSILNKSGVVKITGGTQVTAKSICCGTSSHSPTTANIEISGSGTKVEATYITCAGKLIVSDYAEVTVNNPSSAAVSADDGIEVLETASLMATGYGGINSWYGSIYIAGTVNATSNYPVTGGSGYAAVSAGYSAAANCSITVTGTLIATSTFVGLGTFGVGDITINGGNVVINAYNDSSETNTFKYGIRNRMSVSEGTDDGCIKILNGGSLKIENAEIGICPASSCSLTMENSTFICSASSQAISDTVAVIYSYSNGYRFTAGDTAAAASIIEAASQSSHLQDKYVKIQPIRSITVNNGTASPSTAAAGDTITVTASVSDGYRFTGWTSKDDITFANTTNTTTTFTMPESDVTVTAGMEANVYDVTLDTNGGTINSGAVTGYTYGVGATLPTDITRSGYAFGGWYEDSGFSGSPVTTISTTATGAKTYYARWLSQDAGVQSVTVDGTAGTINSTSISVVLPYGSNIPTDSSKISIIPAAGAAASTPATSDGGATWTFTITAEDGTTTADYTISVKAAENPAEGNAADIAAAKSAIESRDWTVAQAIANTEEAVRTWIEGQLAAMNLNGAGYTVTMTGFIAATGGTAADRNGTNGSFTFTVKLSKGEDTGNVATSTYAETTVTVTNGLITATPYAKWTVTVNAENGGSASGGGTFEDGSTVTVTAAANSGYDFVGWKDENGGMISTSESYSFILTADRILTAAFQWRGPGGTIPSTYRPNVEDTEGGDTTVSPQNPSKGDTVTITPNPDEGCEVETVTVTDSSGNPVEVTENGDGTWSFTQPGGRVTIEVTYRPAGTVWVNPFVDVSESNWFYNDVMFVYEKGLMAGVSASTFAPYDNTTRAQIAMILYRMEGSPAVEGGTAYSDVAYGSWYYDAAMWAQQRGVMEGYGDGSFGPNDPVTREQLAAIFYRCAQYKGYDVTATGSLDRFTDAGDVSAWAQEAMKWAVGNGILNGKGNNLLVPKGAAARAELAVMLRRFEEGRA